MPINTQRENPSQASKEKTHDRNSYLDSRDAAELLPDRGFVRDGVLRTSHGLSRTIGDGEGERSGVSGKTGSTRISAGCVQYQAPPARRVTFPLRVQAAVAIGSALLVAAIWFVPMLIVKAAGSISHLSGLGWIIPALIAYGLLSILFFSMVRVAGISDEMAGNK